VKDFTRVKISMISNDTSAGDVEALIKHFMTREQAIGLTEKSSREM
jgi:hypothetical protein